MYKHSCVTLIAILLVGADPAENKDPVKQDVARLQGRWIAESFEYGGEKHPVERDGQTWDIVGDRITRYVDSEKLDII
ncbi:MAG TPA: hypothetical protein VGZ26_02975, partial [Pirellulales bacterium]|nr:hypothetical protein [Pirellulales bacterium]